MYSIYLRGEKGKRDKEGLLSWAVAFLVVHFFAGNKAYASIDANAIMKCYYPLHAAQNEKTSQS